MTMSCWTWRDDQLRLLTYGSTVEFDGSRRVFRGFENKYFGTLVFEPDDLRGVSTIEINPSTMRPPSLEWNSARSWFRSTAEDDVAALLAEVRRLRAKLDAINDARRPFTNALLREQAAETLLLHSDFMNLPRHIRVSVYDDLAKWVGGIIDCVADGGGDHGEG